MFTPGSPGLRGRPNRAPNWPDQVLQNRPLIPTESPKRAAPAHIRAFTGIPVKIQFTSVNMIFHFLHMEPSNPQTYYTYFTYLLAGLHQEIHINTIKRLMLFSRTQHRLDTVSFKNRAQTDALMPLLEGATDKRGNHS